MAGNDEFVRPQKIQIDEKTHTDSYVRFVLEPLEAGYGHTLGNALRRVLLSSMQGVAATAIRIDGVSHEFCSIPDVVEDVMEIVLNVKKLKFNCVGTLPRTLELTANQAGAVTAAAIKGDSAVEVLNPEQLICTLDKNTNFRMELDIDRGIGYRPSEENKHEDQPLGTIAVDSLFSPVERVRYDVTNCREGERTDFDSLEMEITTDRRILPLEALNRAASILRDLFGFCIQDNVAGGYLEGGVSSNLQGEDKELLEKLLRNVSELHLSVRSVNCLSSSNITCIGQLVEKSQANLLKFKNFGNKSLDEMVGKLTEMGLSLNMKLPENVKIEFERILESNMQIKED